MRRGAVLLAALALAGCGGGGSTSSKPEIALLTAVHATPEGVTFEFRSPPDTVRTRWVAPDQIVESGSGARVPVQGRAVLVVTFTSAATAEIEGEDVVPTYTGPRRVAAPSGGPVLEAVKVGDFEAQLDWAIGVSERAAAAVSRDHDVVAVTFGG